MRKTGKSGVGQPKKEERTSPQTARGRLRLALTAAAESKKPEAFAPSLFVSCIAASAGRMERSAPSRIFALHRPTAVRSKAFRKTGSDAFE